MDAIIVRRNPNRALRLIEPVDVFGEIDRFANRMWNEWRPAAYHDHSGVIPMEMYELKDELVVRAELPGFRKEDIDVNLEGDELTLRATRKEREVPEGSRGYLKELCYGEYSRSVTLPFPVNAGKIEASFENGLLEMKLPKTEESKPKHIEIKVK